RWQPDLEVGAAVVDIPAHDLAGVGHRPAELAGEAAVARADVEDAPRRPVTDVVGDQRAEEPGSLGLPWMAAREVAALGKVHAGMVPPWRRPVTIGTGRRPSGRDRGPDAARAIPCEVP